MEGMNIEFRWPIFDFNRVKVIFPADCADLRRMFGVAAGNYFKFYLYIDLSCWKDLVQSTQQCKNLD